MASDEEKFHEEFIAEYVVDDNLVELLKSFQLSAAAIEEFISKYFYVICMYFIQSTCWIFDSFQLMDTMFQHLG